MSSASPLKGGSGRTKVLAVLLGLLLLVLVWRNVGPRLFSDTAPTMSSAQGRSRRPSRQGGRRQARGVSIPKEIHELNITALDPRAQTYEIGRNLWSFYVPPPPPPPPRVRPEPPPRVELAPVIPPPPEVAKPPRIPFRFLGTLGPKRRRIAVFSEGDEIINALAGDVIQEQFRVAKIGFESVTIEYVDFPDAKPAQLPAGG